MCSAPLPFAFAAVVLFTAAPITADETARAAHPGPLDDDAQREIADLRRRLDELEGRGVTSGAEATYTGDEASEVSLRPFWGRDELDTSGPLRGIYDKPFLADLWNRVHVGGYTELEFHSFEDGAQEIPRGFRMHRTNLFLFTDISDTVRFGSELEFETEFDGLSNSSDIELAVEMAFVDWTIFEELTLRGGALLPPVGRTNVNHDGPVRNFTERPLVATWVIPTTLTEAGLGAHGAFTLGKAFAQERSVSLGYEAYVVNGFDVLRADGSVSTPLTRREAILREGRSSLGGDANDGVAGTGRVSVEIEDRFELGGSWHVGTYDERGDNLLSIFAGDAVWSDDVFTLVAEVAVADFQRDAFATAAGVPDVFWGYSLEASVSGMPDAVASLAPHVFGRERARWTIAIRYDFVDLAGDRGEVIEPGVVFRPVPDTAFKVSWRFAPSSFGLRGVPGTEDFDDEGFVFSITSYF